MRREFHDLLSPEVVIVHYIGSWLADWVEIPG